jgi:lipopolysaccharide transport system permease protein
VRGHASVKGPHTVVIEPRPGWRVLDFQELREFRDLFYFMTWRSIRVRYAQSVMGVGWAVAQPLVSMLVFTVVFGQLARVDSNGVPYALFSLAALAPWTYFSSALTEGTASLVKNANLISKVYFPRLVLPLSAVLARLLDFAISLLLLGLLMAWYRILPTGQIWFLPGLILLLVLTASGISLWLAALAIQYRDVQYAMSFLVQMLMYAAPVVYPTSYVPPAYQWIYALNPLVGIIEGFRSTLLGTIPMPWHWIAQGAISALFLALSGALYFRQKEKLFADVA